MRAYHASIKSVVVLACELENDSAPHGRACPVYCECNILGRVEFYGVGTVSLALRLSYLLVVFSTSTYYTRRGRERPSRCIKKGSGRARVRWGAFAEPLWRGSPWALGHVAAALDIEAQRIVWIEAQSIRAETARAYSTRAQDHLRGPLRPGIEEIAAQDEPRHH